MTETTPETLLADTRTALATARSELETLLGARALHPEQGLQLGAGGGQGGAGVGEEGLGGGLGHGGFAGRAL